MTIRDTLRAITEDKKVCISNIPVYANGEIMTGSADHDKLYFNAKKHVYMRYDNALQAIMDAPDDILNQTIYTMTNFDTFITLDYKVVCE